MQTRCLLLRFKQHPPSTPQGSPRPPHVTSLGSGSKENWWRKVTWAVRTIGRSGMEQDDGISSVLVRRELSYPPVTITLDSLKVTVPVESDSVEKKWNTFLSSCSYQKKVPLPGCIHKSPFHRWQVWSGWSKECILRPQHRCRRYRPERGVHVDDTRLTWAQSPPDPWLTTPIKVPSTVREPPLSP